MKWRSKHLERCIALRVSHFHFALFLSHNCVISSKLSPSLAASIEKFSQLLCYHLIVPWEFQDIAWQSEWQVVHNKYNLYKNLRIWCKVQLLEVCKFVSLQPFMLLWKRYIMPPPPWKITWYFQNPTRLQTKETCIKSFLQIVLQARFSCKLQRSQPRMVACSCQAAFKNLVSHSTRACRKCSWIKEQGGSIKWSWCRCTAHIAESSMNFQEAIAISHITNTSGDAG